MIKFFEKCGYTEKGSGERQNPILNLIDGLLLIGYILLSFINLIESDTSFMVLIINVIILTRFLVKNIIAQKKIANSKINDGKKSITLVHMFKILVESISMVILTVVFVWAQLTTQNLSVVKLIVGFIILFTLLEDILDILERFYNVIPKPLSY